MYAKLIIPAIDPKAGFEPEGYCTVAGFFPVGGDCIIGLVPKD
jgi:hypothetical protein